MKKNQVKIWVGCGIFCIAAVLLSVWYAVTFSMKIPDIFPS